MGRGNRQFELDFLGLLKPENTDQGIEAESLGCTLLQQCGQLSGLNLGSLLQTGDQRFPQSFLARAELLCLLGQLAILLQLALSNGVGAGHESVLRMRVRLVRTVDRSQSMPRQSRQIVSPRAMTDSTVRRGRW